MLKRIYLFLKLLIELTGIICLVVYSSIDNAIEKISAQINFADNFNPSSLPVELFKSTLKFLSKILL